ncbi:MAG TPA: DUF4386 family protein, partial [Dongiaceae bacterium]|nr:DUF4386 family protein [Dongiaceae bacterium]
ILVFLGGAPATAQECFAMIQKNVVVAILRLDILTVLVMPVFCVMYAGFYAALRRECWFLALVSCASAMIGVGLILANASVTSLLYLADQYAAASSEARRMLLLAAGEAVISNDMWHGSAAKMGGLLLQSAGVLISIAMLRSTVFSKLIGYSGLVAHGLDLAHILLGFFWPKVAVLAMGVAGPLYLLWFPLVAKKLRELSRAQIPEIESVHV